MTILLILWKDMDGWLSQVAAIMLVSILTPQCMVPAALASLQCVLSAPKRLAMDDPEVYKGCYWYPSVDACYQNSTAIGSLPW